MSMSYRFDRYSIRDDGVVLSFYSSIGKTLSIFVLDAELQEVATLADFRSLVVARLERKQQTSTLAGKLDAILGKTLEVP